MTGLALNVEDYITKPFDMYELRLRVRNTLKRSRQSSLTHPVTGLPVGELVDERLKIFLAAKNQMISSIPCAIPNNSVKSMASWRRMTYCAPSQS